MGVNVFQSSDIVYLSQLFRPLVERFEHFIQVLHVLKYECLGLIKNQELNVCKKVGVHLLKSIRFVIDFLSRDHSDCQGRGDYDVRLIELFIELDVQF